MKPRATACIAVAALAHTLVAAGKAALAQTPPIEPKLTQTPLPARVELPLPPAAQPGVPDRPLTAEEAARIAVMRHPDVATARAAIETARARSQQARAGLMPNVGFDFGFSRIEQLAAQTSGSGGGSTGRGFVQPGYTASAGLQQLLYDFEHTRDLVRQSSLFERAAAAGLGRTQQDLEAQAKHAFYAYVGAENLVGVHEANVRNVQGHTDLASALLKSGLGAPIDLVRAQAAFSAAVEALEIARNAASHARVELALLMGIDPRTPLRAAGSSEAAPGTADVNRMTEEALRRRPEIEEASSALQGLEHGVEAAKSENAPVLRATAGLVGRGQSLLPRNDYLTVGLGIQWDPFDGGRTLGRVKQAQAGVLAARANLLRAEQAVKADVAKAYLDLKTAEQRVTAADSTVANAQEALRLAEGRYRSGVGVFMDVLDAQSTLLAAKTSRVNAASAVDQARASLKRATGSR